MPTLTGIVCDLSGSMRKNAGEQINEVRGAWARSIFNVIDDLIRHDVSQDDSVFAVGIGASCKDSTFDVLTTIEQFQNCANTAEGLNKSQIVQNIFDILQTEGARNIRKWATSTIVERSVSYDLASLFLNMLGSDREFLYFFVHECLPSSCRDWDNNGGDDGGISGLFQSLYSSAVTSFRQATERDIEDVVQKAKAKLLKNVGAVCTVQNASKIVRGCVGQTSLTDERVTDLMKMVEPFIYGGTPMYRSLDEAFELLTKNEYMNHKKMLFILSDGEPTDHGNFAEISACLLNAKVTIISCFINRTTVIESRRLYSEANMFWSQGARFLYDVSSYIRSDHLPRTIFVKHGWKIDISNNQTKLFMQVNDPENIHDACELAKNVVCSQDSLSDLLASVSLDMYIYQNNIDLKAPIQYKDTCYANASATIIHLATKRILGREGGYPDFENLRQAIIDKYGYEGYITLEALRDFCPQYRLQCNDNIGIGKALQAISEKRPVVATFQLTNLEWSHFCDFYTNKPKGILDKTVINIAKRVPGFCVNTGHAVVFTGYDSDCLRFMNFKGSGWGDNGFFRVQNADVLGMTFIDVFWTSSDLTSNEKAYFKQYGGKVADDLMNKFVGLQTATYTCPLCHCISLVTEYEGTLHEVFCPKCMRKFVCNESGNILAMNIYLTTLASKS
ncbi:uncharacterized protein [Mytilus edulis]|uniref:uncharacterized protein n=1 Tax=Mytilus edulis TaxID=6550 RepID=UPI0039EFBFC7